MLREESKAVGYYFGMVLYTALQPPKQTSQLDPSKVT